MKITESRLRQIIQEELNEITGPRDRVSWYHASAGEVGPDHGEPDLPPPNWKEPGPLPIKVGEKWTPTKETFVDADGEDIELLPGEEYYVKDVWEDNSLPDYGYVYLQDSDGNHVIWSGPFTRKRNSWTHNFRLIS